MELCKDKEALRGQSDQNLKEKATSSSSPKKFVKRETYSIMDLLFEKSPKVTLAISPAKPEIEIVP